MKTYKIVKVEWDDISAYTAWRNIGEVKDCTPLRCVTVGTRVKAKRGNLAVFQTISENMNVADAMIIPKKNVRKVEVIGTYRA